MRFMLKSVSCQVGVSMFECVCVSYTIVQRVRANRKMKCFQFSNVKSENEYLQMHFNDAFSRME